MEEQKRCPYCDELIRSSAVKCRYCGSSLVDKSQKQDLRLDTGIHQALDSKYEIIEEIGNGGMAKVYKAIHRNLNRVVALKIIHQNLIHDEETVLRFRREAQLSASLLHPNIVMVYDEGRINDVIFMSLEFLEGDDLHKLLRNKGILSLKETMDIIIPIAEALDYVHKRNLVHRDVKSSNIFLANGKRPVLTDFGIAYARESSSSLTRAGEVIGTPEFMSPEQASGAKVDGRSDLFSLGIVIFQCLTGQVPFKGDTHLSTIFQITRDPLPNIHNFNSDLPDWITPILEKCMEKDPEKRVQTGSELAQMLRQHSVENVVPIKKIYNKVDEADEIDPDRIYEDDDIEGIIDDAEKLFDNNKYKRAKSLYEKALEIRPEDLYVRNKIEHLDRIFETIKKAEEEKLSVQKQYNEAVKNGDDCFEEKKYKEARVEYQKARSLKRFEKYPKKKLAEVEAILEKIRIEEERELAFNEKISEANELIEQTKWEEAKVVFFKALEIKPEDKYSKEKIKKIDAEIIRIQKEKEEQEAREKAFYKEIALAADLFKANDFEKALTSYKKANSIKSDEAYVINKIKEIGYAIEQLRVEEEERIAKEKAYKNELTVADGYQASNDYQNALASYNKALGLKPDDEYVLGKIKETEDTIEQIRKEEEERIAKEKAFQKEMTVADDHYSSGDYEQALVLYKMALELKPGDDSTLAKVKNTEDIIAQIRKEEEERIAKEKAFQKEIDNADGFYSSADFEKTLGSYKKALELKPGKELVINKIKEVEEKIEQIRKEEEERIALENAFQKEMVSANDFYTSGDYEYALDSYTKAEKLKPGEGSVETKILNTKERIEQKRLDEEKRLVQLVLEEKKKGELNKRYQSLIKEGDELFNQSLFEGSIEKYGAAIELRPDEKYPKSRIELIEEKIKSIQKLENEKAQKDQAYKRVLDKSEILLSQKRYEEARIALELANSIDKDKEYPIKKILEVDKVLEKQKKNEQEKIKLEERYKELIEEASILQKDNELEKAILLLGKAMQLNPSSSFPKDRIETIQLTIKAQKKAKEEKSINQKVLHSAIAKANKLLIETKYLEAKSTFEIALTIQPDSEEIKGKIALAEEKNQNKIKETAKILEKEKEYKHLVEGAQEAFVEKKYEDCLSLYQQAITIKPDEAFLNRQIKIIQKTIQAINEKQKEHVAIEKTYKNTMASAHSLLKEKKYEEAKTAYEIALSIKPDDSGIKDALMEIDNELKIQEKKKEKEKSNSDLYIKTIEKATDLSKQERFKDALKVFEKAIEFRPNENYPRDRITEINNIIIAKKKAEEENRITAEIIDNAIHVSNKFLSEKNYDQAKASLEEVLSLDKENGKIRRKIAEINEITKQEKKKTEKQGFSTKSTTQRNDFIEDKTITISIKQKEIEDKAKDSQDKHYVERDTQETTVAKKRKNNNIIYGLTAILVILIMVGSYFIMNGTNTSKFEKLVLQAKENEDTFTRNGIKDAIYLYKEAIVIMDDEGIKSKIASLSELIEKFDDLVIKASQSEDLNTSDGINEAIKLYTKAIGIMDDEGIKSKIVSLSKKLKGSDGDNEFDDLVKRARQKEDLNTSDGINEAIDLYSEALIIMEDEGIKSKIATLSELIEKFDDLVKRARQKEGINTLKGAENAKKLYQDALNIIVDANISEAKNKLANRINQYKRIIEVANDEYNTIDNVGQENKEKKKKSALSLYIKGGSFFTPSKEIQNRIEELEKK